MQRADPGQLDWISVTRDMTHSPAKSQPAAARMPAPSWLTADGESGHVVVVTDRRCAVARTRTAPIAEPPGAASSKQCHPERPDRPEPHAARPASIPPWCVWPNATTYDLPGRCPALALLPRPSRACQPRLVVRPSAAPRTLHNSPAHNLPP